jgi:polyphosphate glucokinase
MIKSGRDAKQAAMASETEHLTLAIDVGGSHLKAGVLDPAGAFVTGPSRVPTPVPATPAAVLDALQTIAAGLGPFGRISAGFPGMVRRGVVLTAPNLGTEAWHGFALGTELSTRLGQPARVLNDAEVQGLGVIAGQGLECVITLGTGFGFSLFDNGYLTPHMEMGQHNAHGKHSYDGYVGNAAREKVGRKRWNKRVAKVIAALDVLLSFDTLYIGGGNTKYLDLALPDNIRKVDNAAGITGGVKLWGPQFNDAFRA